MAQSLSQKCVPVGIQQQGMFEDVDQFDFPTNLLPSSDEEEWSNKDLFEEGLGPAPAFSFALPAEAWPSYAASLPQRPPQHPQVYGNWPATQSEGTCISPLALKSSGANLQSSLYLSPESVQYSPAGTTAFTRKAEPQSDDDEAMWSVPRLAASSGAWGGWVDEVGPDDCYARRLGRCLALAPGHRRSLQEIYEWIAEYSSKPLRDDKADWKNSVRHNLSMNAAFERVDGTTGDSHGKKTTALWRITEKALWNGVKPTTQFRKPPRRPRSKGKGKPAASRVASGSRGGKATRAAALRAARQRGPKQPMAEELVHGQPSRMLAGFQPPSSSSSPPPSFGAHAPYPTPNPMYLPPALMDNGGVSFDQSHWSTPPQSQTPPAFGAQLPSSVVHGWDDDSQYRATDEMLAAATDINGPWSSFTFHDTASVYDL